MTETLHNLYLGFSVALAPSVLLYAFVGCIVGTLVGVLPGIGPLAGISLLLPASFGLDATSAIVLLAGIYYGAMYGGSTTSILMRIPGEAASVMTCIDGYEMTRKGRAARHWRSQQSDRTSREPSALSDSCCSRHLWRVLR